MNDRHDPYGEIYGYDAYGRPLYRASPPPQQPPAPFPTAQFPEARSPGYYAPEYLAPGPAPHPGYDPGHAYEATPGQDWGSGRQAPVHDGYGNDTREQPAVPPPRHPGGDHRGEYHTEQFAFVEDSDDESEDVIDWLKFTESRTERREEAKRRGRVRRRLLAALLALAVLGGVGYLWVSDRLPGVPGLEVAKDTAPAAAVRDVIAVHLRETRGEATATALLVANETTRDGTTLLLPNELSLSVDAQTVSLGQAVSEEGAGQVRDGLGGLLGADIKGTWRLDTPYLEILVDVVGGITVATDTEVPGADGEDPLVPKGGGTRLGGQAAVAYATHRAPGEPQSAQLERFGQVMAAVLEKMPSDEDGALRVVRSLAQITDPSLSEEELAASLAQRAAYAKDGAYTTTLLPVRQDGTISDETADGLAAELLGGAVTNADPGGEARLVVRDASGTTGAGEAARVDLVNGGFTVVDSRAVTDVQRASEVTYADAAHRETALKVARTLDLSEDAVRQADAAGNADVTVVLGEDYGADHQGGGE